jgi:DNA replication protein DnaC
MTTHDVDGVALHAARVALQILEATSNDTPQYRELRETLLAKRCELDAKRLCERRFERAGFPFLKTIDEFDFRHQSSQCASSLMHALSPQFVRDGCSLVFTGRSGRGKTHLAIAIAHRAIINDFDALFVSASRLVDAITRASRRGRAHRALGPYARTKLLVLDDLGFARHNPNAASVLFDVISERYTRGVATVITANPHPQHWPEVLGDEHAADAILGRLLERGWHVELAGPSQRSVYGEVGPCGSQPTQDAAPCAPAEAHDASAAQAVGDAQAMDVMFTQLARAAVGHFGLKEALHNLRRTMSTEALQRCSGSRRGAAHLLQVDRRYVQRMAEDWASELDAL